jgi:hypothetical protein
VPMQQITSARSYVTQGNRPVSFWAWDHGSPPFWAKTTVIAVCMANLGLKPTKKIPTWVRKHFEKRNGRMRKIKVFFHVKTSVLNEEVSIKWKDMDTNLYEIVMPKNAMTAGSLLLMQVHNC